MEAITLDKQDNKFIISIDEGYVSQETVTRLLNRIKLEHLVEQADFNEDIEELGRKIKADWWANNRDQILSRGA